MTDKAAGAARARGSRRLPPVSVYMTSPRWPWPWELALPDAQLADRDDYLRQLPWPRSTQAHDEESVRERRNDPHTPRPITAICWIWTFSLAQCITMCHRSAGGTMRASCTRA